MPDVKHLLLRNQWVSGWEYGVLRSFENAIVKITGAEIINYPERKISSKLLSYMGHGMDKDKYRFLLPKAKFTPDADVLWVILMGPENFELDLYKGWQNSAKKKVLYLCDTLPKQMNAIKKLFSNNTFDVCMTAFEDAIPELEKLTNHKWHCVLQGAPTDLFEPAPFEERLIHFTSYGRRFPPFHNALLEYCKKNNLYYDYSTQAKLPATANVSEVYKQYAWHLTHSLFNVSWPLELTNPQNAGYLRPITTRWFEAGLSACINIGKGPDNPKFHKDLTPDIVEEINPYESMENIHKQLDNLWHRREDLFKKNLERREANKERWDWDNRVNTMLTLLSQSSNN
jgi:hypothetical protein